jgi:hypothetical protein
MNGMTAAHARKRTLKRWQSVTAAVIVTTFALGLAGYAAAADYATVSAQAEKYHVALAWLNPLGLLGGLFGITIIDIALTWIGKPIWWLREFARIFAIAVVLANGSAGWPSPVGTGLRVAAPALFVIITEAARHTLLHREDDERKRKRDERIPRLRWVLDFAGTFALWRRMRLWDVRSYRAAVDTELSRLVAIEMLAARYPAGWQQAAPADLVFMLRRGVRMTDALAKVATLTAPPVPANEPPALPAKRTRPSPPKKRPASPRSRAGVPPATEVPKDVDARAEALAILAAEPDISGAQLGLRVGRTGRWGQTFKKNLVGTAPKGQDPTS